MDPARPSEAVCEPSKVGASLNQDSKWKFRLVSSRLDELIALGHLITSLWFALAFAALPGGIAMAQRNAPAPAPTPSDGRACPPLVAGAGDKPGFDVDNALDAYTPLEVMLDTFHVRERVREVAVDLSKSPATLDLVADSAADVPLVEGRVPKKYGDVPIEVTESKPYDRFLPYMLRTRGLGRAADPPAGCPKPNEAQRPDLDVIRAMAARIDLEADLAKRFHPGSGAVVDGIGVDLRGKVAALDVTVDQASDVAPVRAEVSRIFEGVPTEVTVIETADATGGSQWSGRWEAGATQGPPAIGGRQ